MESFQPLLGGGADAHPNNNENKVNYGGSSNSNAPSYGSLKNNQSNNSNNSRDVPQSPFTPMGRLPPMPLRQRANSSGDRSVSEISTLSGRSGLSGSQRVRNSSPVPTGNNGYGAPPLASRKIPPPLPQIGSDGSGRSLSSGSQSNNVSRPHPLMRSNSAASVSSRHRINSNDSGFRPPNSHRRQSSSGSVFSISSQDSGAMSPEAVKLLPDPRWGGGGGGANRARSFSNGSHKRHNTFSNFSEGLNSGGSDFDYGSLQGLSIGNVDLAPSAAAAAAGKKKHHRRNSSVGSYASIVSVDQSIDPVTTNLSKSSMLKEVTYDGVVRMQLPKDQFRLLSDRDLETGTVYKRVLVDNEDEYYQDYHMTPLEDLPAARTSDCQCTCESCTRCHTRVKQLPPTHYVMAVKSDIFRRMFDEVSASKNMPCGLFFCGHHEDVRHPSVGIAIVIVSILFAALLLATIYVSG